LAWWLLLSVGVVVCHRYFSSCDPVLSALMEVVARVQVIDSITSEQRPVGWTALMSI
jgi:hypothetical protein